MRGFPVAREGLVFILPSLALVILFSLFHLPALAGFFLLFLLFFLYFFRNPKRVHRVGEDTIISPADGKVVELRETSDDEFKLGRVRQVGIFMSPLDVHVNRAPCEGRVVQVVHKPGKFTAAFREDVGKENERNYIVIESGGKRICMVQIAGFLARRIICYVREGQQLSKGEIVGMIAFGSRVDVYFPEEYDFVVQLGQRVKAGVSALAQKRGS